MTSMYMYDCVLSLYVVGRYAFEVVPGGVSNN